MVFAAILNICAYLLLCGPIMMYLHFLYIDRYKWRSTRPSIFILVYTAVVDTILFIHASGIVIAALDTSFPFMIYFLYFAWLLYLAEVIKKVRINNSNGLDKSTVHSNDIKSKLSILGMESITVHYNIVYLGALLCSKCNSKFMKQSFYNRCYYFVHQRRLMYHYIMSPSE
eukprot:632458_1